MPFGRSSAPEAHEKTNRASRLIVDAVGSALGVGGEWAPRKYGEYYATSTAVHAAVKVRADAIGRPELVVFRREGEGDEGKPVAAVASDPFQRLMDRPNRFMSGRELWRATESNLLLWGSAYWGIERDERGDVAELWPLRPDRMRVLPDKRTHVRGFVYEYAGERVAYLPDEIVWFRHFNPLDEFAGLSPVAPSRLAVEMATEAMKFNRGFFANSAMPSDLAITTDETPTEEEVADFYERWESRFGGPSRGHRPVLLSRGMDVKRLGVTQRDMEFTDALEWSVDEVSRAFGVPKVFLSELGDATLANVRALEQFLWRNTLVPELRFLEAVVNRSLSPHFDEFDGQYRVKFDMGDIESLQESQADRVDRLTKLVSHGVITAEEARAELARV